MKVNRAFKHAVPSAVDPELEVRNALLVWREKQVNRELGELLGPYVVVGREPQWGLFNVRD